MILERHRSGVTQKDIAQELGVSARTVRRALKRGAEPPARRSGVRFHKLDPFQQDITQMLEDNIWNASVIYRKLREKGYEGGYTRVRDYVKPLRAQRIRPGTVRFETDPGKQLQHDWGEKVLSVAGVRQKVYLAVNTLGYSRTVHVVAMPSLDAQHTYEAIQQSFEYFNGVPEQVLVDNQKCAVVDWFDGKARFNPQFRELGLHYGFTPKACRPRRAQTKGKVERMVGYVKDNALCGDSLSFDSFADLNRYLQHWCDTVANVRRHNDLKELVNERFDREQPTLQALPRERFNTAYHETRQVALESWVSYRGSRYSVPSHLVDEAVKLEVSLDGRMCIYHRDALVAEHVLSDTDNATVVVPEHHAALWAGLEVAERSLADYDRRCA